jgi:hypothetical protein
MKSLLNLIALFLCQVTIGQTDDEITKEANRLTACQQYWEYLSLNKKIEGKILFFMQPLIPCGTMSTASNAVIVTGNGDTIRVLQLCDNVPENIPYKDSAKISLRLDLNDHVVVTTAGRPDWRASIIPYDPFSCVIKKTYWGEVKKK